MIGQGGAGKKKQKTRLWRIEVVVVFGVDAARVER